MLPLSMDDEVIVFSAPGEGRECLEIARRALALASEGVAFDRHGRACPSYFEISIIRFNLKGRSLLLRRGPFTQADDSRLRQRGERSEQRAAGVKFALSAEGIDQFLYGSSRSSKSRRRSWGKGGQA